MNLIEVTGEGSVSVPPDKSTVVLGAVTEDPNLGKAQLENNSIITKVTDALLQLNIPKDQIQTVDYRIDMQYSYEDGKQIFKGYQVTHLLQITVEPIEKTGLVVDTAVNQGANSVHNIQFISTHPEAYYNHALTLALKNAESKAKTIAKELNVQLKPHPNQILEESVSQTPVPYTTAMFAEAKATPIQPGPLKLTARLKAQFSFV